MAPNKVGMKATPSSSQALQQALRKRSSKPSEMRFGAGEQGQLCPRCGRRVLLREGFDARHFPDGSVTVTHTVCPS